MLFPNEDSAREYGCRNFLIPVYKQTFEGKWEIKEGYVPSEK